MDCVAYNHESKVRTNGFGNIDDDEHYEYASNLGGGKSRVMPQLAPRFPSSDCTLLRTRSRPQSDCSIQNKIQPYVPTRIRTPTLPLEANLMLIVPPVELCPREANGTEILIAPDLVAALLKAR
ncbi:Uncharacterized protein Fot_19736 [Forsythia ovata]|uniref:Uncharacterized protein n=1 Tax=Forsythia ovata TaxID=205694 RepID=A0ABD1VLX8_9LAMI